MKILLFVLTLLSSRALAEPTLFLRCKVDLAGQSGSKELRCDGKLDTHGILLSSAPCGIDFGDYALHASIVNVYEKEDTKASPSLEVKIDRVEHSKELKMGVPTYHAWRTGLDVWKKTNTHLIGWEFLDTVHENKKYTRADYICEIKP